MNLSPKNKKILIAVVALLVLGGAGYYFFSQGSLSAPTDFIVPSSDTPVGQDVLVLIDKLKGISIDSSFFAGAMFSALRDFTTKVIPEPQGKDNPFQAIGAETSPVSTSLKKN